MIPKLSKGDIVRCERGIGHYKKGQNLTVVNVMDCVSCYKDECSFTFTVKENCGIYGCGICERYWHSNNDFTLVSKLYEGELVTKSEAASANTLPTPEDAFGFVMRHGHHQGS